MVRVNKSIFHQCRIRNSGIYSVNHVRPALHVYPTPIGASFAFTHAICLDAADWHKTML